MKQKSRLKPLLICATLASLLSPQVLADCANEFQRLKPAHQYQDNLNGTATDQETGLTWQKCPVGTVWNGGSDAMSGADDSCQGGVAALNWQQALAAAEANTFLGQNWRAANKNELSSLLDLACRAPAINNHVFPKVAVPGNALWTSSLVANSDHKAWAYSYHNGEDFQRPKNASYALFLISN